MDTSGSAKKSQKRKNQQLRISQPVHHQQNTRMNSLRSSSSNIDRDRVHSPDRKRPRYSAPTSFEFASPSSSLRIPNTDKIPKKKPPQILNSTRLIRSVSSSTTNHNKLNNKPSSRKQRLSNIDNVKPTTTATSIAAYRPKAIYSSLTPIQSESEIIKSHQQELSNVINFSCINYASLMKYCEFFKLHQFEHDNHYDLAERPYPSYDDQVDAAASDDDDDIDDDGVSRSCSLLLVHGEHKQQNDDQNKKNKENVEEEKKSDSNNTANTKRVQNNKSSARIRSSSKREMDDTSDDDNGDIDMNRNNNNNDQQPRQKQSKKEKNSKSNKKKRGKSKSKRKEKEKDSNNNSKNKGKEQEVEHLYINSELLDKHYCRQKEDEIPRTLDPATRLTKTELVETVREHFLSQPLLKDLTEFDVVKQFLLYIQGRRKDLRDSLGLQ